MTEDLNRSEKARENGLKLIEALGDLPEAMLIESAQKRLAPKAEASPKRRPQILRFVPLAATIAAALLLLFAARPLLKDLGRSDMSGTVQSPLMESATPTEAPKEESAMVEEAAVAEESAVEEEYEESAPLPAEEAAAVAEYEEAAADEKPMAAASQEAAMKDAEARESAPAQASAEYVTARSAAEDPAENAPADTALFDGSSEEESLRAEGSGDAEVLTAYVRAARDTAEIAAAEAAESLALSDGVYLRIPTQEDLSNRLGEAILEGTGFTWYTVQDDAEGLLRILEMETEDGGAVYELWERASD